MEQITKPEIEKPTLIQYPLSNRRRWYCCKDNLHEENEHVKWDQNWHCNRHSKTEKKGKSKEKILKVFRKVTWVDLGKYTTDFVIPLKKNLQIYNIWILSRQTDAFSLNTETNPLNIQI